MYSNFTYGDVGVFVMDTRYLVMPHDLISRMFRSSKSAIDNSAKTRLGEKQKADLKEWLLNPFLTFKVSQMSKDSSEMIQFLISPVPYTVRLDLVDGWQGYITEREVR